MTTIVERRIITGEMVAEAKRMELVGELEPTRVWQAAQCADHPMHNWFTWDIEEAAEKQWEWEARDLIKRIVVYVKDVPSMPNPVSVPVFVHSPGGHTQGYVAVANLRGKDANQLITDELARIRGHVVRGWALAHQVRRAKVFKQRLEALIGELIVG